MIPGYRQTCQLCRLAQDNEILTRLLHNDERFIVVDCLVCGIPMAVLKEHKPKFDDNEKKIIRNFFRNLLSTHKFEEIAPGFEPLRKIKWVIDWEQRKIPDHPHCHLRPYPFHNTTQWEPL
jgi:hypothetical protein